MNRGERQLDGIVVTLQDLGGNAIASTTTTSDGRYSFEGLDLGVYRVRVTLPDSMRQTSYYATEVDLTRGEKVPTMDIGVATKHRRVSVPKWWDHVLGQALEGLNSEFESILPWGRSTRGR